MKSLLTNDVKYRAKERSPRKILRPPARSSTATCNTPQARTALESNPLFQAVPAVRRGAYAELDLPLALAIGFPSALSIRYALGRIVPKIRTALD
ncbi:hypothetical protein [Saccharopolyspora pogona]|uniref:hypothetical protein n=1 Tax=Saccharopolyspora pogona TaxID=333966 RepID=UPI001CC25664|nr:hypothetical protein [Saccharopolyspora pogona]